MRRTLQKVALVLVLLGATVTLAAAVFKDEVHALLFADEFDDY